MISTLKKLQDKRAAQEINGGFTLIELLIVIVVLGILAAVVVFSLGSVTGKSAVSACQADGATVNTAMAAYNANNGVLPTTSGALTSTANQGPYLQSWPNNGAHYYFGIDATNSKLYEAIGSATVPAVPSGATPAAPWILWVGATTCHTSLPNPSVA
jgi:general secretion pathway protein G